MGPCDDEEGRGMLSAIVPAHNEEAELPATLAALRGSLREAGVEHEIIVVDDASTDRTGAIARDLADRVIDVRFRQIARVRNAGARASVGARLLFVDADTRVTTESIRAMNDAMGRGVVWGGAEVRFDGRLPGGIGALLWLMLTLYRVLRLAPGCFLFCTREAFDRSGGFDETLFAAEEVDFSRRLWRQGRHTLLRTPVVTSGRKARAYRRREITATLARLTFGGRRAVSTRQGLEFWYGPRRPARAEFVETRPADAEPAQK